MRPERAKPPFFLPPAASKVLTWFHWTLGMRASTDIFIRSAVFSRNQFLSSCRILDRVDLLLNKKLITASAKACGEMRKRRICLAANKRGAAAFLM
eukprot:9492746-Pyramimonas_sp.AAC.1